MDNDDYGTDGKDPDKVRRKLGTVSKLVTLVLGPTYLVLQIVKLLLELLK